MDWSIFQEPERVEQVTITEYLATIREMFQDQKIFTIFFPKLSHKFLFGLN